MRATRTRHEVGEESGPVNRASSHAYEVRLLGRRLEAWNRPACYAVKFGLLGGLLWLVLARRAAPARM